MSVARQRPPGPPTGFFGMGHVRRLRTRLLEYPTELARTYGDLVYVRMGPIRAYFVNHPDLVREVLVSRSRCFRKLPRVIRALQPVDGNGLVLSEGDFWLRQRRLVQPAFSTKRFDRYAQATVGSAREMVDAWRSGTEIEIAAEMRRLSLRIIARTLFGVDLVDAEGRLGAAVETISEIVTRETSRLVMWPIWVPTPDNLRKRKAIRALDDVIRRVIRERRASGEDRGDLLSMLLKAVDEEGDGTGMTDEQARDEAMTLFNAGHDTTAAGLTWIWYLLAAHPEVERKLRQEIQTVLGPRAATYADVAALPYTGFVVKEALRIFPPTWGLIPRVAVENVPLGTSEIPKGGWVYIYPWVLHRDPRFFPDPERFDPDRFAPGRLESIPQHAYVPFGAGPHVCIGNAFAAMEMVLAVATVVPRFRLTLPADHPPVVPEPHIAIRPRGGLRMMLNAVSKPELAADRVGIPG